MARKNILALLAGGDRRSIGKSGHVARMAGQDPKLFAALMEGFWSHDPIVRMRAADAVEKITRKHPQLLRTYKRELLGLMAECEQQEVRWHLALMASRIVSTAGERQAAVRILTGYLEDKSSIVKTFALQGLADLAGQDARLREVVIDLLRQANRTGTAAMKARARNLLRELEP